MSDIDIVPTYVFNLFPFCLLRKMIVHFYVSYNANLEKDKKMVLNFSMILSMPYAFASRRKECVHVFIYIA